MTPNQKIPFYVAQYDLYVRVVCEDVPVKKLTKKYNLTERQIRKIIKKGSQVTKEQYDEWTVKVAA